jgi:hypothetical protein
MTKWTNEEDALLRALPQPITRIAAREALRAAGFQGRSDNALSDHLHRLGLQRPERPGPWSEAEDAALRALVAQGRSGKDLVDALAGVGVMRTAKAISTRVERLAAAAPVTVAPLTPAVRAAQVARDFALINSVVARVFVSADLPLESHHV